ncbi:MAG: nitrilase-related carbon-nitrogen hydrolase [Gammaproteobacteria bacterium]|jgi:predicted amidohydrolase|nr:nitrilase-related carbon-nitrogen hydrolase [Gammaproteobacteria bacterium]
MRAELRSRGLAIILLAAGSQLLHGCGDGADPAVSAPASAPQLVQPDGSYPTVPLEKDTVVVKVIQNGVVNLQEAPSVAAGLQTNLEKMVNLAAQACEVGPKPDFILFNEFPLTGYSFGTRDEKLEFTIEIPGPETDQLGVLAMQCDAYIIFGSYARDADWPGHILSINTVIGRNGAVAQKFWKTRNIKRLTPDGEIPTTTVENVRDRYREMYGIEAEFPVLVTEFGNIAVSTVQLDPFVFAAFAMRGTEIMFRTATLFSREDVLATARFHNFYSAMSNIIFPPDSEAAPLGGGSLIVAPDGRVLAEAPGNDEMIITAEIPIAELRRDRRIPRYPLEVVAPVFEQYRDEIPLNHLDLPADELPATRAEMGALLDRVSRWLE